MSEESFPLAYSTYVKSGAKNHRQQEKDRYQHDETVP